MCSLCVFESAVRHKIADSNWVALSRYFVFSVSERVRPPSEIGAVHAKSKLGRGVRSANSYHTVNATQIPHATGLYADRGWNRSCNGSWGTSAGLNARFGRKLKAVPQRFQIPAAHSDGHRGERGSTSLPLPA